MSGYAAIGLDGPQYEVNVGGVLRAADCYGAKAVMIGGNRFRKFPTDTTKAWRRIPVVVGDDVMSMIPFGAIPVAVDLVEGATSLFEYQHPSRAFYVFGPENGTLGKRVLDRCRDRVFVPTNGCMNLAATVNVVLYARAAQIAARKMEIAA